VKQQELETVGEALHRELAREYYLTGAGLKQEPEFQAIYARYDQLVRDEALAVARESGSRPLLEWVVGLRVAREVAPWDERQVLWEQGAAVRAGDRTIPYLRVPIELANTPDRRFRIALDTERAQLVAAELNPLRRERLDVEHRAVAALEVGDYVSALAALSGIDLEKLACATEEFLLDTADMYREALGQLVARRIGVSVQDLVRADTAWTFRASQSDAAFPSAAMVSLAARQMRELGLDLEQGRRIRFDTEERPAKQPRAFCVPIRVPEEVYVVLRPHGGHGDYRTFWHELGHAMHFASVDPARSFADRWLGDNSVTEGYAMLWDHMTMRRSWLARYTALAPADLGNLAFELAVGELYFLRRYAAKLCYELALHRNGSADLGAEYATRLTDATLFRFPEADHLIDVDPGFYAARYLRAWQFEAGMAGWLTERFDDDWFRNPRAGSLIQELMSRGQAQLADELAREVTGTTLSFAPVIARLEAALN
jgi:hypothetical protein